MDHEGEQLFEFDLQMLQINFTFQKFFPHGEKSQQDCPNRDLNPGLIVPEARIRTTVPRSPCSSLCLAFFDYLEYINYSKL